MSQVDENKTEEAPIRKLMPDGMREALDQEDVEARIRYYRDWKERMESWYTVTDQYMPRKAFHGK